MIDIAILCAIFGAFILFSFITGIKIGICLRKDESIELPNLNPIKKVKEKREKKAYQEQVDEEQRKIEIMLENIENYNGSEIGQQDI